MTDNIQTDTGFVNPVMVAQSAAAALAEQEGIDKGIDTCLKLQGEASDILVKSMNEAQRSDGSLDWEKITAFGGASSQEKQDKIIEVNSRLYGYTKAVAKLRRDMHEKEEAEKVIESNAIDLPNGGQLGELLAGYAKMQPELPSQMMQAQIKTEFGSENDADGFEAFTKAAKRGMAEFTIVPNLEGHRNRHIMAALFQTSSWEQNTSYEPGWLPKKNTPISLINIFHSGPMESKNMSYWQEKTHTSAAAKRAEGAAAAESEYVMEEKTYNPISIAHYLPITEEELEDRPAVEEYVDYVMPLGVLQKMDSFLATGTDDNFTGICAPDSGADDFKYTSKAQAATVGEIAKPWNVLLDAKFQGMQHGFGILGMQNPTHCAVHPDFWLQCLKSETASAGYYTGGPQTNGMFATPWGMELVASNHFTMAVSANEAAADDGKHKFAGFVGDMSPMFHKVAYRHGINVRFGMIDQDFIKFRMAVRAEARACFVIKRAGAFVRLVNPKADGNVPTSM